MTWVLNRPSDLQTFRPSDLQTFRPPDLQTFRPPDLQTFRPSDLQTFRPSDLQGPGGSGPLCELTSNVSYLIPSSRIQNPFVPGLRSVEEKPVRRRFDPLGVNLFYYRSSEVFFSSSHSPQTCRLLSVPTRPSRIKVLEMESRSQLFPQTPFCTFFFFSFFE